MRTGVVDLLPALRRPAAGAALVAFVAGAFAAVVPWLPAWALVANVDALGTAETRTAALLLAHEASPLAWLVLPAGTIAAASALLLAFDVPLPATEQVAWAMALVLAGVTVLLAVQSPGTVAFAGDPLVDVLGRDTPLPRGVVIELGVRPARGLWILGAAGPLVAVGTRLASRGG